MRVATSIPDPDFEAAEELSSRLGLPRSQLYARAVEEYTKAYGAPAVREAVDALYCTEDSSMDPVLDALQAEALKEDE